MTPKEKYEARRAAKRAGYIVKERNERTPSKEDFDPEELIYDLANSLERIAIAMEAMSVRPVVKVVPQ